MKLEYKLIKSNQYNTSKWSGGTTTEIYKYPESSEYQDRNFTWRISSATVDLDTSKFTKLSDYDRIIMVLKGKLILIQDEENSIVLNELDQYAFDGNSNTESEGKVTDFNLMMRKGACIGNIEVIHLDPKSILTTIFEEEKNKEYNEIVDVYYNTKGKIKISINRSKAIVLENKDTLIVNKNNEKQPMFFECYNGCDEDAIVIKTSIFFNNKI